MKKNISYIIISFFLSISCFSISAFAQEDGGNPRLDACEETANMDGTIWENMNRCRQCGDCSVEDFILLAVNISNWILGIVGSLALLMFVYGGFTWILSAGNSEAVEKGRRIIIGSVIGLVIVFSSYTIIQFSVSALGFKNASNWFTTSKAGENLIEK